MSEPQEQNNEQNAIKNLANYEFKTGANWTQENVQTLMQWVHISAIYLEIMSEATQHYKTLLRRNSVLNLILSTLAGTASLSQFSINENNNPTLTLLLKGFFTVMSFIISISVGYLKIYQIQEKMETTIRLQQEWTVFGSKITSEMQLPENLRKDALFLIIRMKETYFELIKSQVEPYLHLSVKEVNDIFGNKEAQKKMYFQSWWGKQQFSNKAPDELEKKFLSDFKIHFASMLEESEQ